MKKPQMFQSPQRALEPEEQAEIRALTGRFGANIPAPARQHGHYEPVAGDGFNEERFGAPDGAYRVSGSDWIMRIKRGRFVGASRAVPPHFGGPNVVTVPN